MSGRQPHCAFCAFEDWLFQSFENVVVTIVLTLVGVILLTTIFFVAIIALAGV